MSRPHPIIGELVQFEEPHWPSLERLVGLELASGFMWMSELRLDDGTRVDAYKHINTRRYLHLSPSGEAFGYEPPGLYRPLVLSDAIELAFYGWQRVGARPEDLDLVDDAVRLAASRGG